MAAFHTEMKEQAQQEAGREAELIEKEERDIRSTLEALESAAEGAVARSAVVHAARDTMAMSLLNPGSA